MLVALAWKNLWRNKLRSLIIITAIALGLTGGLVASGLSFGMGEQMIRSAIGTRLSHIRLENPQFEFEQDVKQSIPHPTRLVRTLEETPGIAGVAPRVVVMAMVSSPTTASGVELLGVVPEHERRISEIPRLVIEGSYLDPSIDHEVVIGRELATQLGVGLGSRIVFTFQNAAGTITGGAFRVGGLFRTVSATFDRSVAYVMWNNLSELLETDTLFQRVSIRLAEAVPLDSVVRRVEAIAPGLRVDTWRELAPELDFTSETLNASLYIFMAVILLALAFGVVNTMLMVILERRRELGMLVAVGMSPRTVFRMVVLETLVLSLTGGVGGLVLAGVILGILGQTGIDLSYFAQGLREFGISEVLYPSIPVTMFPTVALMVMVTALLASIYPALKALRTQPAKALREY